MPGRLALVGIMKPLFVILIILIFIKILNRPEKN